MKSDGRGAEEQRGAAPDSSTARAASAAAAAQPSTSQMLLRQRFSDKVNYSSLGIRRWRAGRLEGRQGAG